MAENCYQYDFTIQNFPDQLALCFKVMPMHVEESNIHAYTINLIGRKFNNKKYVNVSAINHFSKEGMNYPFTEPTLSPLTFKYINLLNQHWGEFKLLATKDNLSVRIYAFMKAMQKTAEFMTSPNHSNLLILKLNARLLKEVCALDREIMQLTLSQNTQNVMK
jgi:hypothetical protein